MIPIKEKTLVTLFPPIGTIFTMNARCENLGCQGSRFRSEAGSKIICHNCGTIQGVSETRGAHFWATRRWRAVTPPFPPMTLHDIERPVVSSSGS